MFLRVGFLPVVLENVVFGVWWAEKKVANFWFLRFCGVCRGVIGEDPLYMVVFDEKALCQNVPRVGFDAASMCQDVCFAVPMCVKKKIFGG